MCVGVGATAGGMRTPIALHCGSFIFNMAVKVTEIGKLSQHSIKVRPFRLYIFVVYSMVLEDKRNHCFLVCNLRPVFEKVKFKVSPSLEPFKDLNGCFDPSSTALTKRSQMLSNSTCVSCILSASV